ncbi:MAG: hypothetical protein P4L85_15350 [Paludisphaera borealis]|uniref:hypothetical protein n=1 Tax=Paludisphaera borealis TaxID=1387353 RepID=UPI002846259F|nr:hypothetical protein [Paludisphaera borealis]MDR3620727.1 hypothetical protein [Paludisphaera borealis]
MWVSLPGHPPARPSLGASDHASVVEEYPARAGLVSGIRDFAAILSSKAIKNDHRRGLGFSSNWKPGAAPMVEKKPRPTRRGKSGGASRSGLDGRAGVLEAEQRGQFLDGEVLEFASLEVEAGVEADGDVVQFRKVDPKGQLGEFVRVEVAEVLLHLIELDFEPRHGFAQLVMGLGGTSDHQALRTSRHALLVVGAVESESDEGGTDASRS